MSNAHDLQINSASLLLATEAAKYNSELETVRLFYKKMQIQQKMTH
jgi:hypothetical protein